MHLLENNMKTEKQIESKINAMIQDNTVIINKEEFITVKSAHREIRRLVEWVQGK